MPNPIPEAAPLLNSLSMEVLGHATSSGHTRNAFISGPCIARALAMAAECFPAASPTHQRIVQVISGVVEALLREVDAATLPAVRLMSANAVALKQGLYQPKPSFVQTLRARHSAEVLHVSTAGEVNQWVAGKTESMITDLLPEPLEGDMVMVSALYFKGAWGSPFQPCASRPFRLMDGSTMTVPMMDQTADMPYATVDGNIDGKSVRVQVVQKDFGTGGFNGCTGAWSYIVLPPPGLHPARLLPYLDAILGHADVKTRRSEKIHLTMPKFRIRCKDSLKAILERMNLGGMFTEDPTQVTDVANSRILDVIHEVVVAVDEQGVEAAAATAVTFGFGAMAAAAPPEVVVDRPFVFVIKAANSDLWYFCGTVMKPNQ